jgi:probable HAF family extracellular repeat protein
MLFKLNRDFGRPSIFLAACLVALPCLTLQAQQFSILDLGSLGGPMAGASGLSTGGLAVGFSATPGADLHAFVWDGAMHDLAPVAGATQSHAFTLDALGNPLGVSYVLGGLTDSATLWQAGIPSMLSTFTPHATNAAGTIVGYVSLPMIGQGWVDRACIYRNADLTTLTTLGGSFAYANAVDASDRIVGMSYTTGENARRACLWLNNQPLDLGTLGGANSQAYAINNAGQVVGVSDTATGKPHAFLYTLNAAGQVTARADLGELGGGHSTAYALSDRGEAVGTSNSQAFYWYNGQMVDLSQRIPAGAGWTLLTASAINDNGQIAGMGFVLGFPHAFLLTPVAPDFDHDGDVDQSDFAHFQECYSGPAKAQTNPACRDALLDGDSLVDHHDFEIFQACFSGPGITAEPACWRQ